MDSLNREPEIWIDVPGCDNLYQISSWGNVFSCERIVIQNNGFKYTKKAKLMKPYKSSSGYLYVNLNKKKYKIHILVCELFVDSSYGIVNHKDGDKLNNYYKNLEKVNHRENISHWIDKSKTSSKYIGVSLIKNRIHLKNPWRASCKVGKKSIHIGFYNSQEEAHQAYLEKIKSFFSSNKYSDKNQS